MHPAIPSPLLPVADSLVDPFRKADGLVVTYWPTCLNHVRTHDKVTQASIGKALAVFKGYAFAEEYDTSRLYPARLYFMPGDTLAGIETARDLGIRTEDDLFGGVVPHPFIATKAITHGLVEPAAAAPQGWSHRFALRVSKMVLPGFTAFSLPDARRAGKWLLDHGPVRIKPAQGTGWCGQLVIAGPADLDAALSAADATEVARHGLVLEQNLVDTMTCSVGQLRVGGMVASYFGTQRATTNNRGATVYGGSNLLVVRGDFDSLSMLDLAPEAKLAILQAQAYDAATDEFPGLLASRRNYDIVQGYDPEGLWRSGVLEQSWRIGGASGPEVAALAALRADPTLRAVHAWCVEAYGSHVTAPPRAIVHFCGVDDHVGPLTKYTVVEPHVTAA